MTSLTFDDEPAYCYIGWPDDTTDAPIAWAKDRGGFHVGQCYTGVTARQIACKQCGSEQFHVAQDDYLTVIRCPFCRWERVIHDG